MRAQAIAPCPFETTTWTFAFGDILVTMRIMRAPSDTTIISPGVLGNLIGYHLRRAYNVVSADFAQVLGGTGIRPVLFSILSIVHDYPKINQGLVGKQLGIQRPNMVSLINELLERGLLTREVSSEDRRAYELSLSEAGHAMYRRCAATIREHEDTLLADFSEEERALLISLLVRIEAIEP